MSKGAKRRGIALAVAVMLSVTVLASAGAQDAGSSGAMGLFNKGLAHYKMGEYAEAKDAFDKLLAMNPGMKLALAMRERAELGQFIEMRDNELLADQAQQIFELMVKAVRLDKRTVADADQLVKDFESDDLSACGKATVVLKGYGPYAVPYLVQFLGLEDPGKQVLVARTVSLLAGMHGDAALPLTQVLLGSENQLVKARVAAVLGQLGDDRVLPALTAVWNDKSLRGPTRTAAGDAIQAITGRLPQLAASTTEQYAGLSTDYFEEQSEKVGFTYGFRGTIWSWDADSGKLASRDVPSYLYYQAMAAELALEGLRKDPESADLQALLAASLARQLGRCRVFSGAEATMGGSPVPEEARKEAAAYADQLGREVPVALGMLKACVVADALRMTLAQDDAEAVVVLEDVLRAKLRSGAPAEPCEATGGALVASLNSPDKLVREKAAVVLVESCPAGTCGPAVQIMTIMAKAVRAVEARTALVIMDSLQRRNRLVSTLAPEGIGTVESGVLEGQVLTTLEMQPSVDVIFLSTDAGEGAVRRVLKVLSEDYRTKGLPIYAVADPSRQSVDVPGAAVVAPDALTSAKVAEILKENVFGPSKDSFTEAEVALVLAAAEAAAAVDPARTDYPLGMLEPSLVRSLGAYNEQVSSAVVACLASFGTEAAIEPLSAVVAGDGSVALKTSACAALAATLRRTGATAPEAVVTVLKAALDADDQGLREAAAAAMCVAGLGDASTIALTDGHLDVRVGKTGQ